MTELTELQQAYQTMQAASGLEVGDKVRVLRKAEDWEMGWRNNWTLSISNTIGQIGRVTLLDGVDGIKIETINSHAWYPFFVLELVEKAPKTKPLTAGEYDVEFAADGDSIQVSCQTITFDEVKAIHRRMKKLRKAQPKHTTEKRPQ